MNQLIERLIAESTICQGHPQIDGSYFDKEKFAELIVRECINICDKEYVAQIGTPASAYNSAVKKCRDRIAENFGISE
jgi:hypothetical protein